MRPPTPDPAHLRRAYEGHPLVESVLATDPFEQFARWFADAIKAGLAEANAMVLSTASPEGEPSARTVLLKGHGRDGFRFFTNHTSRKGRDLVANPRAVLVFPWHALHRQVIVSGTVERLPEADAQAYFRSRPYGSQIGAWASERQSSVISSRDELMARYAQAAERWPEPGPVPMPDYWGGYLVVPITVEFWQGRSDRLHDRFRYRRDDGKWAIERLSP